MAPHWGSCSLIDRATTDYDRMGRAAHVAPCVARAAPDSLPELLNSRASSSRPMTGGDGPRLVCLPNDGPPRSLHHLGRSAGLTASKGRAPSRRCRSTRRRPRALRSRLGVSTPPRPTSSGKSPRTKASTGSFAYPGAPRAAGHCVGQFVSGGSAVGLSGGRSVLRHPQAKMFALLDPQNF